MSNIIEIYTDGACKGNPGPGGWGVVLHRDNTTQTLNGGEASTTNNRMELTAAIEALAFLSEPCQVTLYTDSKYVMQGISAWLPNWKRKQWKTAGNKPVKNVDLWQRLDTENQRHQVEWLWVKGHSGNPGNEQADQLANEAISKLLG